MELHRERRDTVVPGPVGNDVNDTQAHPVSTVSAITTLDVLRHAAETGGGPTGFGWASFVTFAVGAGVVLYSAGQLMKAVHARRTRSVANHEMSDGNESTTPGGAPSTAS